MKTAGWSWSFFLSEYPVSEFPVLPHSKKNPKEKRVQRVGQRSNGWDTNVFRRYWWPKPSWDGLWRNLDLINSCRHLGEEEVRQWGDRPIRRQGWQSYRSDCHRVSGEEGRTSINRNISWNKSTKKTWQSGGFRAEIIRGLSTEETDFNDFTESETNPLDCLFIFSMRPSGSYEFQNLIEMLKNRKYIKGQL